jgi:hypothetical protein
VNDPRIDDVLRKAAQSSPTPDPILLDRIAGAMQPSMAPVRPMPSVRMLSILLASLCIAIGLAGGFLIGMGGSRAMTSTQRLIFPALAGFIAAAGATWASAMIPGSKRREAPWNLLCAAVFTLLALFPTLFHDHHSDHFVHAGLVCLALGLSYAVPIGLAGWWLTRRGFAVNARDAALAAGTLAGLGGIGVLELHCPNFQLAHLLVWHTAVIPLSAALAVGLTKLVQIRRANRNSG